MASDTEVCEATARNIVNNHRFDIGGEVATYWMKRCDEAETHRDAIISRCRSAEIENLHLKSGLAEAEARAERYREALVYIARCAGCGTDYCVDGEVCHGYQRMTREQLVDTCVEDSRRAKAALLPPADGGGGE